MKKENLIKVVSLGLLLIFWGGLSWWKADPQILPSPISVSTKTLELWQENKIQKHLLATGFRVVMAFILAMAFGIALGYLMGRYKKINQWLDPWLIVFLNLPALIIIVLCLIWIGLNEFAVITAVTLNKIPLVTTIIREGARNSSSELRDLAQIYKLPVYRKLRYIILPELYPSIIGAARSGLSVIWKIVLVVEFLGGSGGSGIGLQIHTYFSIFDVTTVLAYALSFVAVILFVELIIVSPLERHGNRWRGNATS